KCGLSIYFYTVSLKTPAREWKVLDPIFQYSINYYLYKLQHRLAQGRTTNRFREQIVVRWCVFFQKCDASSFRELQWISQVQ
ncbi:hypothetical protein PHAVU_L001672, partial [Phaseolus vulgaris]